MQARFPGFPPEARRFFRQLRRNNNRDWFLAHKDVFEQKVKLPMVGLVRALAGEVRKFAPEIETEPSKAIYRIYRDTRFSRDKSPYKTQIAASFNQRGLARHASAGLYFHISAEEVLIAGGMYMPGSAELRAVRSRTAKRPEELRKIVGGQKFRKLFGGLEGEQLKRVPAGYPADHPAADLLRYKQYLAWATHPASLAEGPGLLPAVIEHFRAMMPLVRYLNASLAR